MMRKHKSVWTTLILASLACFSGGCIDGIRFGLQGGIEDAIAATVETLVTNALVPVVDPGGE